MAVSADLQWVRANYDTNNDCLINKSEFDIAKARYAKRGITRAQYELVSNAYYSQQRLCPEEAKGKIINFSYPSTAKQGGRIAIKAAIQNSGDEQGSFKLQLYRGTSRVAQSTQFTVAANSTGATKTLYVTTPGSGASIAYTIKCVRLV